MGVHSPPLGGLSWVDLRAVARVLEKRLSAIITVVMYGRPAPPFHPSSTSSGLLRSAPPFIRSPADHTAACRPQQTATSPQGEGSDPPART